MSLERKNETMIGTWKGSALIREINEQLSAINESSLTGNERKLLEIIIKMQDLIEDIQGTSVPISSI
jgi:hypothetical protein